MLMDEMGISEVKDLRYFNAIVEGFTELQHYLSYQLSQLEVTDLPSHQHYGKT